MNEWDPVIICVLFIFGSINFACTTSYDHFFLVCTLHSHFVFVFLYHYLIQFSECEKTSLYFLSRSELSFFHLYIYLFW